MPLNIPWIISRRRILLAITIDLILNIYFYSKGYLFVFKTFPNFIVTISLSIFWIISSYIIGRYMVCRYLNFVEVIKAFSKSIFIFFTCNLIYLFINIFNEIIILLMSKENNNILFQKEQTIFFFKITLLISCISWIFQYFISVITNNLYKNKKNWLFYGKEAAFNDFKKEVHIKFRNFIFQRIDSSFDIKKLEFEVVEGIILENNDDITPKNLEQILFFKSRGIAVLNSLKWCELFLHRIPPYLIKQKYQIIDKFDFFDNSYKVRIKRIGDLFISLLLLIITLPVSILICIFIYYEDKGPIFYSQIRTGFKGEEIRIYKFRSMVTDAERYGAQWSSKEDKRVTKVGKIIRATRLDELPQLLSVVEGKMSLIGPRPERPEIEESLLKEIPFYKYRNVIKPGISGWAQVNYPYGASLEDTINKLSYDIYYISHVSFLLDLLILFKTIKIVFNARGSLPIKNSRII